MGFMPFALSVHSLVSSVGADAGFAAVVGLAILVLLYFAHARETETLREEAHVLTERLQQAEAKLGQLRRGQPGEAAPPAQPEVVPPPSHPVPATPGARAAAAAPRPAAPAGVGAPALAAATRYVPDAIPAAASEAPAGPPPAAAPAPAVSTPPAGAPSRPQPAVAAVRQAAATASPPQARPDAGTAPAAATAPAPATAAGAANGGREGTSAAPPVARPPLGRRPGGRTPPPRAGSRGRLVPPAPPPKRPSATARRVGVLVAALLVVGAVAGLLIATSSGGSSQPSAGRAPASNAPSPAPKPAPPAFNPGSVTVAVLNGTSTNNLAHKVGSRLVSGGYKQGMVATASDQTRTKTVVAYLPGHRDDALHVATALKLGPSAVAPVDSSTQAIACPPPASCSAQVIVTVGSDLASL